MANYKAARDFPAVKGPELPGRAPALRHGVDPADGRGGLEPRIPRQRRRRDLAQRTDLARFLRADPGNFPHAVHSAFKPDYDAIQWESGEKGRCRLFQAWCEGRTGYPLVDAAMAQINQTGYMHNRLRMVTASFLVKDLGIDWRRGERYFAEKLNDFDLSANNGGWQWAASTGCDAQPYFRIFNPVSQSEKFDVDGSFIRKYVPALAKLPAKRHPQPLAGGPLELAAAGVVLGKDYPLPIVQHDEARALTLQRYAVVKKS
jgi:deoxyribodipyrimidine photo-lyase